MQIDFVARRPGPDPLPRGMSVSGSLGGGILADAIGWVEKASDGVRQPSRGGLGPGRVFKTLDNDEAGDLAFKEGVQELGIVAKGHASVRLSLGPCK